MEVSLKKKGIPLQVKRRQGQSIINKYLSKSRKYYIYDSSLAKQQAMKENVETYVTLAVRSKNSTLEAILNKQVNKRKQKLNVNFFTKEDLHNMQLSHLRSEVSNLVSRLAAVKGTQQSKLGKLSHYQEYIRLSEESFDYIEYYLRDHSNCNELSNLIVRSKEKKAILSMLKNYYPCFTSNAASVAHRIFLAFELNPLNDFHFVLWETFSKMRRMMSGDYTRSQGKVFLTDYFFVRTQSLTKAQFWAIFEAIIGKLSQVLTESHVDGLNERIRQYGEVFFKGESISRAQFQATLTAEPMFIWHEFIKLIFIP